MYCFACGVLHRSDPRVACVRWVRPEERVELNEAEPVKAPVTNSSRPRLQAQEVRALVPARVLVDTMWARYRSVVTPNAASSTLFGYVDELTIDALPAGWDTGVAHAEDYEVPFDGEDVRSLYENWSGQARGVSGFHGAALGGLPNWDQHDATPNCELHGAMRQLLEHAGDQFLDGALHFFVCAENGCDKTAWVAEF